MTKCYDLPTDCECGPTDSYWFEYCRLHKAAPKMLEALKAIAATGDGADHAGVATPHTSLMTGRAKAAVALAEEPSQEYDDDMLTGGEDD